MANHKRDIKIKSYMDALEDSLASVTMALNHLDKLDYHEKLINNDVLQQDRIRTLLNLEIELAAYCVLLRKMYENHMIDYSYEIKRDINSIIHCTRFELDKGIVAYSQKGKEAIELDKLLRFGEQLVDDYL